MHLPHSSTLGRIARYVAVKSAWLFLMVVTGIFITVIVINFGGYIDDMRRSDIAESLNFVSLTGAFEGMTPEQIEAETARMQWEMEEAAGLHQPFLLRCARWTYNAVRLDLGNTWRFTTLNTKTGVYNTVAQVIRERLPRTLLLGGTANLFVFLLSLGFALRLARRHGSWIDRLMVALAPVSATPNWIYGILLIVFFAGTLRWLPFGGMYDKTPPATQLGYVWIIAKHMILPGLAIFLSAFFQSVYAWRTFYLMHIEDDHVEIGRAKGVPEGLLERRYIMRPTLPYLITNFALLLISFWQGVIVLEMVFDWPGIAAALLEALRATDRNMVLGVLVVFAYILAITVFLLDIAYALVDPKVRISGESQTVRPVQGRRYWISINLLPRRSTHGLEQLEAAPGPGLPAWLKTRWDGLRGIKLPAPAAAWQWLRAGWRVIAPYPSAVIGMVLIGLLAATALTALVVIPQDKASQLWSANQDVWAHYPRNAEPVWTNWFRRNKKPETVVLSTLNGSAAKEIKAVSEEMTQITMNFTWDFQAAGYPQNVVLNLASQYQDKKPLIVGTWIRPDGASQEIYKSSMTAFMTYYLDEDPKLIKKLGVHPLQILMQGPVSQEPGSQAAGSQPPAPRQGRYTFLVTAYVFEPQSNVDGELTVYGTVSGVAGTDDRRRDISLALLWGAPVALAFGLFGSVATAFATMFLAALGVWFGGWVDAVIQRLTEINMLLPALPIAITVYYLYSKSVWAILGVIVLLNIFGSGLKSFRAVFLQVKEAPYIEAAQAYGVGSGRMIGVYLLPRILPVLIPQIVIQAPGYIFLEASLAYMGVSDPFLPTWGKLIFEALSKGAFAGYTYWILEPVVLLMLTGLAFALVGFALERVFNPRLRTR